MFYKKTKISILQKFYPFTLKFGWRCCERKLIKRNSTLGEARRKAKIARKVALKEKNNEKIKLAYKAWGFKDIDDKLMNVLNKWALFLYDPILKNEVRRIQDSDSGIYGAKIAGEVHKELRKYGGVKPPREFVFMDRAAVGLGSIFIHLKAEINWYKLFHELIKDFSVKNLETNQKNAISFSKKSWSF